MELDAAPVGEVRLLQHLWLNSADISIQSPTPSEPDNERRQEDRLVGDPPTPLVGGEQAQVDLPLGGGEEEEVDLDDDVEDLDGDSGEEEDGDATMDE